MKTQFLFFASFICILMSSCGGERDQSEVARKEILAAEKEFAALCAAEGIEKAFTAYAAEEATILLGDSLLRGRDAIAAHYAKPKYRNVKLEWSPDFADAARSGDLGYTFGHYIYTATDSTGKSTVYKGVFHSVWKKLDGKWKFVWDN